MWVIQNEMLTQLPDDVPVPAGSRVVKVPHDFVRSARSFRIANGELVRAEVPPPADRLTRDDVVQLKQALASGAIGGAGTQHPPKQHTVEPRPRKKEGK